MTIINWVLVGVIAFVIVLTLITTISHAAKSKKEKALQKNQTTYNNSTQNEVKQQIIQTEVTLDKNDIVIPAQKTLIASKNGELKPGKYNILSAESSVDCFNVRIGKFVKEYHHGDVVVVADGEEVTPTSHKIILR